MSAMTKPDTKQPAPPGGKPAATKQSANGYPFHAEGSVSGSDASTGTPQGAEHGTGHVSTAASSGVKQLTRERSRRYGFVGIIVPHNAGHGPAIQGILSDHAHLVQGRMGLPHLEDDTLAVITLIVHGSTDELGSLTGSLGRLPGVTVKSGLAPLVETKLD